MRTAIPHTRVLNTVAPPKIHTSTLFLLLTPCVGAVEAQRLHHSTQERHFTPRLQKGDLEIRDIVNLTGKRDLVIDVALVHDLSGNS